MATARAILERGDGVLIFPEGTRIRPGALGRPKRGVGRLALETGAPVVPVAVIGTEDDPPRLAHPPAQGPHPRRAAAALPARRADPSPQLAGAVTDRIWPCVVLQWEWLGGLPPLRRAAVIGAGCWGTALAVALARAGLEVELGAAPPSRRDRLAATRTNDALPARRRAARRASASPRAAELELAHADLVVPRRPRPRRCPPRVAAHGDRIPPQPACSSSSKGLVPPLGDAAQRLRRRARRRARASPSSAAPATPPTRSRTAPPSSSPPPTADFARQVARAARRRRLRRRDHDRRRRRRARRRREERRRRSPPRPPPSPGPNAAGAAAGKVFAEVDALARRRGGRARDVRRPGRRRRPRRHRRRRRQPQPPRRRAARRRACRPSEIGPTLGQTAEALDALPLLAARPARRRRRARRPSPGWPTSSRARVGAEAWAALGHRPGAGAAGTAARPEG